MTSHAPPAIDPSAVADRLAVPRDKLRQLVVEARRLQVPEGDTDAGSGSNPIDDGFTDGLTRREDGAGLGLDVGSGGAFGASRELAQDAGTGPVLSDELEDGGAAEIEGLLEGMNRDELADVLALTYLGQGDFDLAEWDEARRTARERTAEGKAAADLLELPNFADLLDEGMSRLGIDALDDVDGADDLDRSSAAD